MEKQPINYNLDLATEITIALEAGFTRHLSKSIKYSPFYLFFSLFQKSNPGLMDQVRSIVRNDVNERLLQIEHFDISYFVENNILTSKGRRLVQICYNIGIHLLKKQLNLRSAFKLITNANFRQNIYYYVLDTIYRSARIVLHHKE